MKHFSIWTFIASIFIIYGCIILACGIYYWWSGLFTDSSLYQYHPSIWWGTLMLLFGVILFFFDYRSRHH